MSQLTLQIKRYWWQLFLDQTPALWHTWIESRDMTKIKQAIWNNPCDCSFMYGGSNNAQWISMNKMPANSVAAKAVRHVCQRKYREFICKFRVIIEIVTGLFGRFLWSTRVARVLPASFAQSPQMLHKQHLRSPVPLLLTWFNFNPSMDK